MKTVTYNAVPLNELTAGFNLIWKGDDLDGALQVAELLDQSVSSDMQLREVYAHHLKADAAWLALVLGKIIDNVSGYEMQATYTARIRDRLAKAALVLGWKHRPKLAKNDAGVWTISAAKKRKRTSKGELVETDRNTAKRIAGVEERSDKLRILAEILEIAGLTSADIADLKAEIVKDERARTRKAA